MAWSKEVFAENLRYYMESRGKSQKELAEIVGVSAPTMNEWLKAKKYPRIDKIEILANYFGILKSDLIEDKTEKPATPKDDGLSEDMEELIACIKKLPEDKVQMLLQVARSIR
jgi:transcriptional regulator with XRE-family HTH domain